MIAISVFSALLIMAGLFLILGIRPKDVTVVLLKPFKRRKERQQRIRAITGKKPGFIQRQLRDAQQMLDAAGMSEQVSTYKWLAVILAFLGFAFGLVIENTLAAIVMSSGLAIAPLAIIRIRTGEYFRCLHAKLEIGMGIVTNAYIQSGDLVGTIQTSLHLLPSPLDDIFGRFLVETQFIDANLVRAIEQMRDRIDNRYWRDWCSVLIQCQHDRQLRFALPGIVERLGEMRRAQMEVDTTIRKHFGDYIITVMIVLGSIPLMGFMMPDWYDMLMHTLPGKITLSVILFAVLSTAIWVARINQPMDMEKGGESI